MNSEKKPIAFLSYSHNDEFCKLLADQGEVLLAASGFEVKRYRTADGHVGSVNYDATSAEWSLNMARNAHITVAIISSSYYGWVPPNTMLPAEVAGAADQHKSMCRLEYEVAFNSGRTVFAMLEAEKLEDTLEDEFKTAYMKSLKLYRSANEQEKEALARFRDFLTLQKNTDGFSSVKNFHEILRIQVKKWRVSRRPEWHFTHTCSYSPASHSQVSAKIAERMSQPGRFVVSASRGMGATSVVYEAAREFKDAIDIRNIIHIDCRSRSIQEIEAELRNHAEEAGQKDSHDEYNSGLEYFDQERNILIFDGVETSRIIPALPAPDGPATTIVITNDQRVITDLDIPRKDRFSIPRLGEQEGIDFLQNLLPAHIGAGESEAIEAIAKLLRGWVYGLRAAGSLIHQELQNDVETPVARVLDLLNHLGLSALENETELAQGLTAIQQLAGRQLNEVGQRTLAELSILPESGFSAQIAASVLKVDLRTLYYQVRPLKQLMMLRSDGLTRYVLQRETREIVLHDANTSRIREEAKQRLEQYCLSKMEAASTDMTEQLEELIPDADVILKSVLAVIERDHRCSRTYISGIRQLSQRIGNWSLQGECANRILELRDDSLLSVEDRSFWLEIRRVAAARDERWADAERDAREAVKLERQSQSDFHLPDRLTGLAKSLAFQKKHAEAMEVLQEALEYENKINHQGYGKAITLHQMSKSLRALNRREEAVACLEESLNIGIALKDEMHLSQAYTTNASFRADVKDWRGAHGELDKADTAARSIRDPRQRAFIAYRRASLFVGEEKFEQAKVTLDTAESIAMKVSDWRLLFKIRVSLAGVLQALGERDKSRDLYRSLIVDENDVNARLTLMYGLFQTRDDSSAADINNIITQIVDDDGIEDPRQASILLNVAGRELQKTGWIDNAIEAHQHAERYARQANDTRGVSISIIHLSQALEAASRIPKAITVVRRRLAEHDCGERSQANLLNHLAKLLRQVDDVDEALQCVAKSIELEKSLGGEENPELAFPLHTLGSLLNKQSRYWEAISPLEQALKLEESLGNEVGRMKVLHTLARALLGMGEFTEATIRLQESKGIADSLPEMGTFHLCQLLNSMSQVEARSGLGGLAYKKLEESVKLADEALKSPGARKDWRLARHLVLTLIRLSQHALHERWIAQADGYLNDALNRSETPELLDAHIYAANQLASLQSAYPENRQDPLKTLEDAFNLAIERSQMLLHDGNLTRLIKVLVEHQKNKVSSAVAKNTLEKALELQKFPRLRLMAARKYAQMLTDREDGTGASSKFYRKIATEFLDAEYYYGVRRIVLDWVSAPWITMDETATEEIVSKWIDKFCDRAAPPKETCSLVMHRARILRKTENFHGALEQCDTAGCFAAKAESEHLAGAVALLRAEIYQEMGEEEKALELILRECERLERMSESADSSNTTALSAGHVTVSDHAVHVGRLLRKLDPDRAREFLRSRFAMNRERRNVQRAVIVARELARINAGRDYVVEAEKDLKAADEFARQEQDVDAQAFIWQEFGNLWRREGNNQQARSAYERCIELRRQAGNPMRLVASLRTAATHIRHNFEDFESALKYASEALEQQNQLLSPKDLIRTKITVGALKKDLEQYAEAESLLLEAVDDADQVRHSLLQGSSRLTLSAVLHAMGRSEEARELLRQAIYVMDEDQASTTFRYTLKTLANSLYTARRGPEAIQVLREYNDAAIRHEYPKGEVYRMEALYASALRVSGLLPSALAEVEKIWGNLEREDEDESEDLTATVFAQLFRSLRFRRALILMAMNKPDLAIKDLEDLDAERLGNQMKETLNSEYDSTFTEIVLAEEDVFPRDSFMVMAKVAAIRGDGETSHRLMAEAHEHQPDVPREAAIHFMDRSRVYLTLEDSAKSRENARQALNFCAQIEDETIQSLSSSLAHARVALTFLAENKTEEACLEAETAVHLAKKCNSVLATINAKETLARSLAADGRHKDALRWAQSSLDAERDAFREAKIKSTRVTKHSVTIYALLESSHAFLGNKDKADSFGEERRKRQAELESQGVAFTMYDLAETNKLSRNRLSDSKNTHSVETRSSLSIGEHVLGEVLFIRGEATDPGVDVRLADGTEAFCPSNEIFLVGAKRDPRARFTVGEKYPFVVKELAQGIDGNPDVILSQAEFLQPLLDKLEGEIVEGTVKRSVQVEKKPGVEVELATGELLRLVLRRDVTFGKDKHINDLWQFGSPENAPRLRLKLILKKKPRLRLTGSARVLFEDALEQLRVSKQAVAGRVLDIEKDRAYIRLTSGVVGVCRRENLYYGSRRDEVRSGDNVAVTVESVNPAEIRLERCHLLARQFAEHIGKSIPTLAQVVYVHKDGNYLLAELCPGVTGLLQRKSIRPQVSANEFRGMFKRGQEICVRVRSSNHNNSAVKKQRNKHEVGLVLLRDQTPSKFEIGLDFLEMVAKPTVAVGPLVQDVLKQASDSIVQDKEYSHEP